MSEKTDDPKELQVFISEKTTNEKEKASRFSFFKKKKPKDETDLPGPVLPLVKFDSEGDFFKEKLESKRCLFCSFILMKTFLIDLNLCETKLTTKMQKKLK